MKKHVPGETCRASPTTVRHQMMSAQQCFGAVVIPVSHALANFTALSKAFVVDAELILIFY